MSLQYKKRPGERREEGIKKTYSYAGINRIRFKGLFFQTSQAEATP